jgi:hypothetical protein
VLRPGDLFGDVPAADAYVLAGVLHDWDDDHASRILRGLRRAAPPGARVFVLTLVIPENGGAHPAKTADIGMMALFGGGRERTEAELRDLLAGAGWRVAAVTPTLVAAVIVATEAGLRRSAVSSGSTWSSSDEPVSPCSRLVAGHGGLCPTRFCTGYRPQVTRIIRTASAL